MARAAGGKRGTRENGAAPPPAFRGRPAVASVFTCPYASCEPPMSDPNALIPPPLTPAADVDAALAQAGFAVVGAEAVGALAGAPPAALDAWLPYWDRLPPDAYLLDGGKYRQRRHGTFIVDGDQVSAGPPRPPRPPGG